MKTLRSELPAEPLNVEAHEVQARLRQFEVAGVPARHRNRELQHEGPWADARARLLAALGAGAIIVLTGKRGCGKTQLAVEAIRVYCRSGYSARYTKAIEIFLSIREGMMNKAEKAAVRPFTSPDLLVVDAMEERGETAWEDRMLGYILDVRYDALQDTILVTNQERARFAESVGASVVSRIHETGDVIECDWDTFRKPKATGARHD